MLYFSDVKQFLSWAVYVFHKHLVWFCREDYQLKMKCVSRLYTIIPGFHCIWPASLLFIIPFLVILHYYRIRGRIQALLMNWSIWWKLMIGQITQLEVNSKKTYSTVPCIAHAAGNSHQLYVKLFLYLLFWTILAYFTFNKVLHSSLVCIKW